MTGSRLFVMRHAKSDWYSGAAEDFLRPLSDRGQRDARRMGRWMAAEGWIPARILSSPARRTRETLALLAEGAAVPLEARTEWVEALYLASLDDLLEVVKGQQTASALMLLGHNPGLEELVDYLAAGNPELQRHSKEMPTGALYVLDLPGPLDELGHGQAAITCHQRPKALDD